MPNARCPCRNTSATCRGPKGLFITGYAENAVLSHGHLDAGMHVLTKPFAMEVLAGRIKELMAGR